MKKAQTIAVAAPKECIQNMELSEPHATRIAFQQTIQNLKERLAEANNELAKAQEAIESGVRLHRGEPSEGPNALCNCPSCVWLIKRQLHVALARQPQEKSPTAHCEHGGTETETGLVAAAPTTCPQCGKHFIGKLLACPIHGTPAPVHEENIPVEDSLIADSWLREHYRAIRFRYISAGLRIAARDAEIERLCEQLANEKEAVSQLEDENRMLREPNAILADRWARFWYYQLGGRQYVAPIIALAAQGEKEKL